MDIEITKLCKDCEIELPINKFQPKNHCCISCKNRKYRKDDYFKDYYVNHRNEIKQHALEKYHEVYKLLREPGKKLGRPKKNIPYINI